MKHLKYYIVSLLFASFFCGCDKFLDIEVRGNTDEDKMFNDVQGFKEAMYGIYATLAKPELYGENMSYGFVDDLAQLYYIPISMVGEEELELIHKYAYTDQKIIPLIERLWKSYYKAISYTNNVLRHVERIADKTDYTFIKGEAFGLRAFLHFEVLRLYADNIQISHPDTRGIPYSFTFDLENKTVFSLKDSYANILKDLDEAEKLLDNDNPFSTEMASSDYQSIRYIHFNKYAVFALKARVYTWMKDYDNALKYAKKVIEQEDLNLVSKYGLVNAKKFPDEGELNDELIWGLSTDKMYTYIYDRFLKFSPGALNNRRLMRKDVNNMYEQHLFTANSSDARYSNFILPSNGEYVFIRLLERGVDPAEETKAIQGICMLRLPEMYYIAAEATFDKSPTKALEYYNAVRKSRGLRQIEISEAPSKQVFNNFLLKERIKEFWGEGQIFLDYKRMNVSFTTTDNKAIEPSKEIFVLPWPRNERDFGNQYDEK